MVNISQQGLQCHSILSDFGERRCDTHRWGHECNDVTGHSGQHACTCGFRWHRGMVSEQHENALAAKLQHLENEGWRTFHLRDIPDAIAVKDGKVIAVEILRNTPSVEREERIKRQQYSRFDDVIFDYWSR